MNNIIIKNCKNHLRFTYNGIYKEYNKPVNVTAAYFDFYQYASVTSYKSIIFDFNNYSRKYNSVNELLNIIKYFN